MPEKESISNFIIGGIGIYFYQGMYIRRNSMSLATEMFPKLSGGENFVTRTSPNVAKIIGDAVTVVTSPAARASKSLYRSNPETGRPEGALAVMKEQLLRRMFRLRRQKSRFSYRRHFAFA